MLRAIYLKIAPRQSDIPDIKYLLRIYRERIYYPVRGAQPPFDQTAILVIGGMMIGLAQYIALRHTLSKAFLWVPVSAFAWFLGFKLGFAMLPFVAGNPLGEIALVYGSAGLTIGAITGMAAKLMVSDRTAISGRQLKLEKNKQWAK